MPSVEERLAAIETRMEERGRDVDRRLGAVEASITALASAVGIMTSSLSTLTETTKSHMLKATCINGGAKVLQGGGAASGIAATVFYIGSRLGWW